MRDLCSLVDSIEKIIDTVNFKKIYNYIEKQKIAIYNDGFLYFSDSVTSFSLNTRENIRNHYNIAILNYEDLEDNNYINAGLFVKQMVLNMFYRNHDRRIPNNLIALKYPSIYLNYDYMRYERQLLIKAFSATDNYVKLNNFRMFLNVRDLRRQLIGNEFSMLEYGLETIYGLSDYAMLKTIELLDKKLMKSLLKSLVTNFHNIAKDCFDFTHANLYSGLFIVLLMIELQIDIIDLFESDLTLYQICSKKINFIREPIAFRSDKTLLEKLNEYEASISEKFAVFFENEPKRVNGYFQIYAYDPDRIVVDKDNFYHESFVILKNLTNHELIKLNGPIVTKVLDNSYDIVTSYYYLEMKRNFPKRKKKKQ